MPVIETLVEDIKRVLDTNELKAPIDVAQIGDELAGIFQLRFAPEDVERGYRGLRASKFGVPCTRQLWYDKHQPPVVESLPPAAKFKFLYGDIIEVALLNLVRWAGHSLTGEQTELSVDGVKGHRDAVIDGMVVDVKSASTYSFGRFRRGLSKEDDKFGYLWQLKFYLLASKDDPLVTEKNRGAFLVCCKETGAITLDIHEFTEDELAEVPARLALLKEILDCPDIPDRAFEDEKDGASGNRKLSTNCSYCPYRFSCWPDLRTYYYAGWERSGPRYLTYVVREPNVPKEPPEELPKVEVEF